MANKKNIVTKEMEKTLGRINTEIKKLSEEKEQIEATLTVLLIQQEALETRLYSKEQLEILKELEK